MRWKPWLVLGSIVVLAIGTFAFFSLTSLKSGESSSVSGDAARGEAAAGAPKLEQPLITFIDPVKGPADAPTTIVEYGDYVCPFCRAAEENINLVLSADPGRIRFVWKDLPNQLHPGADLAAEAGLCAKKQGKFWEYRDLLLAEAGFPNQTSLTLIANELGLDLQSFGQCLASREMRPLVERNIAEAEALGIDGTPYFFINGKRYSGQLSYEQLEEAVKQ